MTGWRLEWVRVGGYFLLQTVIGTDVATTSLSSHRTQRLVAETYDRDDFHFASPASRCTGVVTRHLSSAWSET